MWEPQHLTTLWASMACYRDSFTFTFTYFLYGVDSLGLLYELAKYWDVLQFIRKSVTVAVMSRKNKCFTIGLSKLAELSYEFCFADTHCVHCADLSEVHRASLYVISAHAGRARGQLFIHSVITGYCYTTKSYRIFFIRDLRTCQGNTRQTEVHSFGNHLISKSVSVTPPNVTEASLYSARFCVFMARVRYNLEQRVFIHDCYAKKRPYTNRAGENFTVNFSTQYVHLMIQFPNKWRKFEPAVF
jgi:hypothetical protein